MKNKSTNKITICAVCGTEVLVDQFGQGKCSECGWYKSGSGEHNVTSVVFPNIVSFAKAKRLYKEGKPLKPSLNDFIEGLLMYAEVQFDFQGNEYAVMLTDAGVEFGGPGVGESLFNDEIDFYNNAKINGELLIHLWHEVENANYM